MLRRTVGSHRLDQRGNRLGVAALVLALGSCLIGPASSAGATTDVPADGMFVANGPVNAVAVSGGYTYLGGSFSMVGPRIGSGMELSATGSGEPTPSAFPQVAGGEVHAVAPDGSGGWYIGGTFTHVGGQARSRLAHINSDGSLDGTWNPGANRVVRALAVSPSGVFAGGDFTSIGGEPRNLIAKLSASGAGAADTAWSPSGFSFGSVYALAVAGDDLYAGGFWFDSGFNSRSLTKLSATGTGAVDPIWNPGGDQVYALAVSGSHVYVGGSFWDIGGQSRSNIAKLSTSGTGAADPTWNPDADNTVRALAVAGLHVYAGGHFSSIGGQPRDHVAKLSASGAGAADLAWAPGYVDDAVLTLAVSSDSAFVGGRFTEIDGLRRRHVAKLSSGTGAPDAIWDPNPSAAVNALVVSGSKVYAGGDFGSAGAQNHVRNNIARLAPDGGLDLTWDPDADGAVSALAAAGSDVVAGGSFTFIGGQPRNRIAKLSASGGTADTSWNPGANGNVLALAAAGTDVYAAGEFTSIGGQLRNRIAKLPVTGTGAADVAWNPNAAEAVRALAVAGEHVYAGGSFDAIGGQTRAKIAKLSAGTGLADATWNPGVGGGPVFALAVSDSGVYIGGGFSSVGGAARRNMARVSASGVLDATWNPDANSGNYGSEVNALAVSGADVYVAGAFTTIGGQARSGLARLSAAGTGAADAAWNPGLSGRVRAISASGSTVVVGGQFNAVGSRATQGVARFSSSPSVQSTTPDSPANVNRPKVVGVAEAGSTVSLYTSADCSGPAAATGPAATFANPGLEVTVADNTTTTFRARTTDALGNVSPCSLASVTYVEDSTAPVLPSNLSTTLSSPANANVVKVAGTAEAGSTVRVYTTADCSGTAAASGAAATFAQPGLEVTVADDSTTTFRATAADAAGNVSACSAPVTYVEDSAPPVTADDVPVAAQPGPLAVTLSAADAGGSGVLRTHYATGADPAVSTASAVYDPAAKPVLRGGERIRYFSVDRAGNTEAIRTSAAVRVMLPPSEPIAQPLAAAPPPTAPVESPAAPVITARPASSAASAEAVFRFTGVDEATFHCSLDGGDFAPCASPKSYAAPKPGEHVFRVRQVLAGGPASPAAEYRWTVEAITNAALVTILPGPAGETAGDDDVAVASTGDAGSPTVEMGCRLEVGSMSSCQVDAYVRDQASRGRAVAAAGSRVLIGRGERRFTGKGTRNAMVEVTLNARGRRLLATRPAGLRVIFVAAATLHGTSRVLRDRIRTTLIASSVRLVPSFGMFAPMSAELDLRVRRYLLRLRPVLATAKSIRCEGYTSISNTHPRERLRSLGLLRARAVCSYLSRIGLAARTSARTFGPRRPLARRWTLRETLSNQRVELVVIR